MKVMFAGQPNIHPVKNSTIIREIPDHEGVLVPQSGKFIGEIPEENKIVVQNHGKDEVWFKDETMSVDEFIRVEQDRKDAASLAIALQAKEIKELHRKNEELTKRLDLVG